MDTSFELDFKVWVLLESTFKTGSEAMNPHATTAICIIYTVWADYIKIEMQTTVVDFSSFYTGYVISWLMLQNKL